MVGFHYLFFLFCLVLLFWQQSLCLRWCQRFVKFKVCLMSQQVNRQGVYSPFALVKQAFFNHVSLTWERIQLIFTAFPLFMVKDVQMTVIGGCNVWLEWKCTSCTLENGSIKSVLYWDYDPIPIKPHHCIVYRLKQVPLKYWGQLLADKGWPVGLKVWSHYTLLYFPFTSVEAFKTDHF